MKYFFVFCLMVIAMSVSAQSNPYPPIVWDKDFGGVNDDDLIKIIATPDGGALLCGYTYSDSSYDVSQQTYGDADYWVVRVNSDGDKLWDKRFGGISQEYLYDALATVDGGFILAGYSLSDSSGSKTQHSWGGYDYWIVKIDSNGNQQWDRDFGGGNDDYCTSIAPTTDGGYVLAGYSNSGVSGNKTQPCWGAFDYWMVKIDETGTYQWDKRFGGTGYDELFSVEQAPDGGYLLAGASWSDSSGDKTQDNWSLAPDYWIVRTDSFGIKLWDKRVGSTGYENYAKALFTADGGFVVAGESDGGISGDKTTAYIVGHYDYWLVCCNANGTVLWDSIYGGFSDDVFENISAFERTPQGGFLIGGSSHSPQSGSKSEYNLGYEQSWIVVTDSLGHKLWDKTILTNGDDEYAAATQDNHGGFWLGVATSAGIGGNKTQDGHGLKDFFVMKLFWDSASFTPPTANIQQLVTNTCTGTCIAFGNASTNASSYEWFFPGASPSYSTDSFPQNICYAQSGLYSVTLVAHNGPYTDTAVSNNLIQVHAAPSPSVTQSNDTLYCTSALTGLSYQWSLNGNLIGGATNHFYVPSVNGTYSVQATTSNGCAGSATLLVNGLGVAEPNASAGFSLSPNPAHGQTLCSWNGADVKTIELYNVLGIKVAEAPVTGKSLQLDVSNLANGAYLLKAVDARGNAVQRKLFVQ